MPIPILTRSALAVLLVCATAGLAAGGPPDPEAAALAWALSYRSSDAAASPSRTDRLVVAGEMARRSLLRMVAEGDGVADRLRPWLMNLQQTENMVEARSLDHAVPYLLACGQHGLARVQVIAPDSMPANVHPGRALAWWAPRARAFRWLPAADRFVAWEPWGVHQAPLRFRGRDRVVLEGSQNLVRWDSPITVEAWVRWAHPTSAQYLLTDEAWPELNPEALPTSTKRGFALRRNPQGGGVASLDLTLAVAPDHWISVESAPLAISDDWEHIAATSDGRMIRLFRNGELVAAASIASATLLSGLGDLTIGAREHGLGNRAANFDLRAFQISEGARYIDDFVPEQALTAGSSALLAPEFRAGSTALRDRCMPSHRHDVVGARWVPAVDAAAVRQLLSPFGGKGSVHVFEADRGGRSAEWYLAERDTLSEGLNAEIWSEREPDAAGHWISVPLHVPSRGRYRVHLAGPGLERLGGAGLVSPFVWRIAGSAGTVVTAAVPTIRGLGGSPDGALSPLGIVELDAGERVFHLRLLARRRHDQRYSFWLDAVVLEAID